MSEEACFREDMALKRDERRGEGSMSGCCRGEGKSRRGGSGEVVFIDSAVTETSPIMEVCEKVRKIQNPYLA